jgi:hypothetical protein
MVVWCGRCGGGLDDAHADVDESKLLVGMYVFRDSTGPLPHRPTCDSKHSLGVLETGVCCSAADVCCDVATVLSLCRPFLCIVLHAKAAAVAYLDARWRFQEVHLVGVCSEAVELAALADFPRGAQRWLGCPAGVKAGCLVMSEVCNVWEVSEWVWQGCGRMPNSRLATALTTLHHQLLLFGLNCVLGID